MALRVIPSICSLAARVDEMIVATRCFGSVGMSTQVGEHSRNGVAPARIVFRPHVDRNEGDERLVGQLSEFVQIAAEASGADRQDDVVERAARGRGDPLEARDVVLLRREAAVPADPVVEDRARRLQ